MVTERLMSTTPTSLRAALTSVLGSACIWAPPPRLSVAATAECTTRRLHSGSH